MVLSVKNTTVPLGTNRVRIPAGAPIAAMANPRLLNYPSSKCTAGFLSYDPASGPEVSLPYQTLLLTEGLSEPPHLIVTVPEKGSNRPPPLVIPIGGFSSAPRAAKNQEYQPFT